MNKILQDIKSAIGRSGFPLEHYIGLVLKQHGWQIITNRNYIDDVKGIEREIDILAYKIYTDKVENIDYVTTLIISCKKNDKQKWSFLTKNIDKDDCNINFMPFHYCSSDKRLRYMTDNHLDIIIDAYKRHKDVKSLYEFGNKMVFAYQQLMEPANENERKQKGEIFIAKNEDIYNSISTTIKAISNEKKSRLEAYDYTDKQRYYTFNAISVFEGDMFEAHFDSNNAINVKSISSIKYLNRHIVDNLDDFYIVHFVNKNMFDELLNVFDSLHEENTRTISRYIYTFYENIFEDEKKVRVIWDIFESRLILLIRTYLSIINKDVKSLSCIYHTWQEEPFLEICLYSPLTLSKEDIAFLNNFEDLTSMTSRLLKEIFRYNGKFIFDIGLPFY